MKGNKKRAVIFLLLFTGIAALTFVAYAAFTTSSGNFKRVIAARTKDVTDSNALRFSSNYLSPYTKETTQFGTCPISVSSDSDVTIGITVCNYPQDNPSLTNDNDINYTVIYKVLNSKYEEISNVSVRMESPESLNLRGKEKNVLVHKITVSQAAVKEISEGYIQVIVTPTDNSLVAAGNNILAANLKIVPSTAKETAWVGTYGDNSVQFSDLDAFNYQISGTEQCTLKLAWNKEMVTLSDWSIQALDSNADTKAVQAAGSIIFQVGGQDQPTSYMLQFYRTGADKPNSTDDLNISLTKQ